jgi:serine/threonine protein kinase
LDENKRPFEDRETIPFAGREGESTPSASLSGKIGPYRLLRKLGEGGMGVVYLAEQENPKRQVALKVIGGG